MFTRIIENACTKLNYKKKIFYITKHDNTAEASTGSAISHIVHV